MPSFLDYQTPLAFVLEDNPDVSPRQVLAFEHASRYFLDIPACLVYRDWLMENGCKRRVAHMNDGLEAELEMMSSLTLLLQERATQELPETYEFSRLALWARKRVELLKEALAGQDSFSHTGLSGVAVIRYPETNVLVPGHRTPREVARGMAENLRVGSVLGLPNTRNADGDYEWNIEIHGGPFGQVTVARRAPLPEEV